MTMSKTISRGFSLAAVAIATLAPARAAERIPDEYRINGFAIGCQAYTFNRFSAFEAIEKTAAAGGRVIEFYPGQKFSTEEAGVKLDQNLDDEHVQKLKEKLDKHKIKAVNFGVVGLPGNEEASRKVFEFAKKMGIGIVTSEPDPKDMDLLEKLVKEYDIKLALHNHPKPTRYWDPNFALSVVKDRDPRIGVCADTGHWVRSGIKPIDALKILEGRIISSHLKDLDKFGGGHDMPFGQGVSDIPAILTELKRQNFDGNISIEYEYNWDNSVTDVAQCIGFVRGYTAGWGDGKTDAGKTDTTTTAAAENKAG